MEAGRFASRNHREGEERDGGRANLAPDGNGRVPVLALSLFVPHQTESGHLNRTDQKRISRDSFCAPEGLEAISNDFGHMAFSKNQAKQFLGDCSINAARFLFSFVGATKHLYKRVYKSTSIRGSLRAPLQEGLSVRPSVRP